MVAELPGRGGERFPEIGIYFRTAGRLARIAVPPTAQIATAAAAIAVAIALSYFSVGRIRDQRTVADREGAVVRAETANADLQDEVANLRDQLALALRESQQAEANSSALTSQAESLRSRISAAEARLHSFDSFPSRASQQRADLRQPLAASDDAAAKVSQLTQALEQTQHELHQAGVQRAAMGARLSRIERDRADQQARSDQYKAALDATAKKLQQVSADRDKAIVERDRLRARIAEIEQKHTQRQTLQLQQFGGKFRLAGLIRTEFGQSEAEPAPSDLSISDAPPEPERESHRFAEFAQQAIDEFRRVLASTGLNVERLFPQVGQNRAQGGPFVPPPKGDQPGGISTDKLEAMRSLIKSLPLSAPLDYYQLESPFGPRHDPFNRRLSFHTGIDLSAPYMSPVYATAAGVVTYVGYRSDYGKVVEVDHGNGIATVYAHLHRYIVSVGQTVAEHTQIGFLGTTGRSSGPHVHYEVLVNDEPQDPQKFIGLAGVIPVTEK
jgi:murein DD-endopeptidase MepM/ murein hydrolase activator NlpD